MNDAITITCDGKTKTVSRSAYLRAKLKQLREFGYPDLTLNEITEQLSALETGKEFGNGLTVIGMMMDCEVHIEKGQQ